MAEQVKTGKAFEYALLQEFYNRLHSPLNTVAVIDSLPYRIAKKCFDGFSKKEQELYSLVAREAINFLVEIEPRLTNGFEPKDVLQLEIVPDSEGQSGDVRDVLAIRLLQKWEIGVSAKNNHRAVKHSRLSQNIDFGKKWLGIPCSNSYFKEIYPVFSFLKTLKEENEYTKWGDIDNMHEKVYMPLLVAFRAELLKLDKENPFTIPQRLVEYLIGKKDFYKIIKSPNTVEIQAYNLHGSLNQPFEHVRPSAVVPRLKLPSRLIEVVFENNSKTTLIVSLNEGWQISIRIHSAKSTVEPSLKFDINLVSAPHTLFTTHIFVKEK